MELDIEELRKEATELGIKFQPKLGAEKLKARIDEHYESQETSEQEIVEAVKANEESEEKSAEKSKGRSIGARAAEAKAKAEKTKVVTIIDNDQRVNNQTTTCTANCTNDYFDLGTVKLPLNMDVEVRQGHLNTLKEVKIPQHVKDPKTGLNATRMVPRYTISFAEKQA
jgi:hypothetical protein